VQSRLLTGDIRNVSGNGLHEFSQTVNMAVQLFLCSGKSGQLGIERFGMGLL
jgi:hypothetical protein